MFKRCLPKNQSHTYRTHILLHRSVLASAQTVEELEAIVQQLIGS